MVKLSWQDHRTLGQRCAQELNISSVPHLGLGNFWLPLVLTARGLLFGEVIARLPEDFHMVNNQPKVSFYQPLDLKDQLRQPLYRLGKNLLTWIEAMPGVYLVQFDLIRPPDWQVQFDQILPFPDLPAIASVGVQQPDLFQCHLACLRGEPVRDLVIANRDYLVLGDRGLVMVSGDD